MDHRTLRLRVTLPVPAEGSESEGRLFELSQLVPDDVAGFPCALLGQLLLVLYYGRTGRKSVIAPDCLYLSPSWAK